jgi:hypothetical protein
LAVMNFSASEAHHPDPVGECSSTASSPVDAARGTSTLHTSWVRYARIYDRARSEGASVAEAMELVEAELRRFLEQRHRRVA